MRKFIGLAVVTALLWVAAAPAGAVNVGPGQIEGKLRDWTTFFFDGPDADSIPETPRPTTGGAEAGVLAKVGDEVRAVFRVTSLLSPWGGSTVWSEPPGEELTGLLYDMEVESIYDYTAAGTVTSISGSDRGTYRINLIPVTAGLTTVQSTVPGAGGRIDVYFDTSPDFSVTNPQNWVEGAAGAQDSFATISDGSPWLFAEFVPLDGMGTFGAGSGPLGPVTAATVYQILVTITGPAGPVPSNIVGEAHGYANVDVNNTGTPISEGLFGIVPDSGADISVNAILKDTLKGYGWPLGSEDPVLWLAYVPEPASMSLLLVGLVGGAGAYWRRRRAA